MQPRLIFACYFSLYRAVRKLEEKGHVSTFIFNSKLLLQSSHKLIGAHFLRTIFCKMHILQKWNIFLEYLLHYIAYFLGFIQIITGIFYGLAPVAFLWDI